MSHRFHEVRKGERQAVLQFAAQHGCAVAPEQLRHTLSLAIERDDALLAVALCVEPAAGQFKVEIVAGDASLDEALISELADRCLRKVQAQDIAAARLHSPTDAPTEAIWSRANWLDRVKETPPPDQADNPSPEQTPEPDSPAQAA